MFIDAQYAVDAAGRLTSGEVTAPFLHFVAAVSEHAQETVLLGRGSTPDRATVPIAVPRARVERMPDYPSLHELGAVARAVPGALAAIWRWAGDVDVAWVFGPHPLALVAAVVGRARGRRVVLGVRQDGLAYYRSRRRRRRDTALLAPLWVMEHAFRLLGRRAAVTTVGAAIGRTYGYPRPHVMPMVVSLVDDADIAAEPPPLGRDGLRILTVGRLAPEKTPHVAVAALACLTDHPTPWTAQWVGTGPLMDSTRAAADAAGLGNRFALAGYVPFGPSLRERYAQSHIFLHTAETEGVPQVLIEALAAGCAVVATDVGGVREVVEDGRTGLLVPPGRPDALAAALRRLLDDADLRTRLAREGLRSARALSRERQAGDVAAFLFRDATPDRAE